MIQSEQLAEFQAAMLDIFSQQASPEEILGRLRRHPAAEHYQDYLDSFDLKMVEVAAALVKKWGVRKRRGGQEA